MPAEHIALLKSPGIVSVMSWCSASIPASGQPSSGGIFHTGLRWDGGSGQKMDELHSNSQRGNACNDVICHIHRPEKKKKRKPKKSKQKQIPAPTAPVFFDRGEKKEQVFNASWRISGLNHKGKQ